MEGDDLRIAAVLQELAELGRRIGQRAGELARLTAERRRAAPTKPYRSDGTASVAAAAADLAAETARVVAGERSPATHQGGRVPRSSVGEPAGGVNVAPAVTAVRSPDGAGRSEACPPGSRRESRAGSRQAGRGQPRGDRRLPRPVHGGAATARTVAGRRPRGIPRRRSRGSVVTRGLRRLGGPLVASITVHLVALVCLATFVVAVDVKPMAVALTLGETAEPGLEEAGLDEMASAEIDAPLPEEPTPLEEAAEPVPLEDLLAAEPPPLAESLATTLDETPADRVDADEAAAEGDVAPAAVDSGGIGAAVEADGGKRAAVRRVAAARGKPAATFFGRAGQGKSVCFICDNSSSYRDGRFHAVLDELMRAIEGLRPDQSFFVIFSSDAAYPLFHPEPVAGLQSATAENKRKLRAWLGTVEMCRGGQGIDDAVRLAATLDADCVYLLSDGELAAGTVERLGSADFGGAAVHTFGIQGTLVDKRTGQPDPGKLFRQEGCNRNLAAIAAAHGGTFTPVTVPPAAAVLERLRPIPRNRSRGPVWGSKL